MTTETPTIVDALPYIDTLIDHDEDQRTLAMKLVDDELEIFPPDKDYLDYLPDFKKRPFCTDLIKNEHHRIDDDNSADDRPSAKELEHIKIDIPPPASSMMDEQEIDLWNRCLNQVKIKLEYKQKQLINLELLRSYGAPAWEQFIKECERMECNMSQELDTLGEHIREINSRRRNEHEKTKKALDVLENQWEVLTVRNRTLFEEIERMKSRFR